MRLDAGGRGEEKDDVWGECGFVERWLMVRWNVTVVGLILFVADPEN